VEEDESALPCMHSTLAFIGREADIVVCAIRGKIADEIGKDILGLYGPGAMALPQCRRA
jgi:hypothetical protein